MPCRQATNQAQFLPLGTQKNMHVLMVCCFQCISLNQRRGRPHGSKDRQPRTRRKPPEPTLSGVPAAGEQGSSALSTEEAHDDKGDYSNDAQSSGIDVKRRGRPKGSKDSVRRKRRKFPNEGESQSSSGKKTERKCLVESLPLFSLSLHPLPLSDLFCFCSFCFVSPAVVHFRQPLCLSSQ
jgi:hypothetical protein